MCSLTSPSGTQARSVRPRMQLSSRAMRWRRQKGRRATSIRQLLAVVFGPSPTKRGADWATKQRLSCRCAHQQLRGESSGVAVCLATTLLDGGPSWMKHCTEPLPCSLRLRGPECQARSRTEAGALPTRSLRSVARCKASAAAALAEPLQLPLHAFLCLLFSVRHSMAC